MATFTSAAGERQFAGQFAGARRDALGAERPQDHLVPGTAAPSPPSRPWSRRTRQQLVQREAERSRQADVGGHAGRAVRMYPGGSMRAPSCGMADRNRRGDRRWTQQYGGRRRWSTSAGGSGRRTQPLTGRPGTPSARATWADVGSGPSGGRSGGRAGSSRLRRSPWSLRRSRRGTTSNSSERVTRVESGTQRILKRSSHRPDGRCELRKPRVRAPTTAAPAASACLVDRGQDVVSSHPCLTCDRAGPRPSPKFSNHGKARRSHSSPLSTYSAPGGLRQDPGQAAESAAGPGADEGMGPRRACVVVDGRGRGDEPLVGPAVRLRAPGAEVRV